MKMARLVVNTIAVIICILIGNSFANASCEVGECVSSYFAEGLSLSPQKTCYSHGNNVTVTCAGFIGGPTWNQCNNGAWVLPSATCEVFNCTTPATGEALNVSPDKVTYGAREEVSFICTQGYQLYGTATAVCDGPDTWNPTAVPICTAICIDPVIVNGGLTADGPFTDGGTAEVQCDVGYGLAAGSNSFITCTDGEWGDIPECYGSCNISAVPNTDLASSTTVVHDQIITVQCGSGFSYDQQTSFTLLCQDGDFSDVQPDQCYADCTLPTTPINGSVTGGILHGQTAVYRCNRGFRLNGTETISCEDGWWSDDSTPVCEDQSLENSITLFCEPGKYVVEIPGPLLGESPTLQSVLLGTCEGSSYDGNYLYANSSYTECGTTIEVDSAAASVIYRNTLTSIDTNLVTTVQYIEIHTMCVFDQNNLVSSSAIINVPILKDLGETSMFDISFKVFTDPGYVTQVTESTLVDTNTYVYLLAEINYVHVDLFPVRCYATPQPEVNYHVYVDLITDGCPDTVLVDSLTSTATTKPNFAFRTTVFRFTSDVTDRIYIHCDLKVCPLGECPLPNTCSDPQLARRRRSTDVAFSRHVSTGPIRMPSDETAASGSAWQMTAITVYSALISAVMLGVAALMVAVKYRKGQTTSAA